jgi:hypothetical protein
MVTWDGDTSGSLPAGGPISLPIALAAFRALISGDIDRDLAELRAHLALMERLLPGIHQDEIRREFGELLASERTT